MSTGFVLNIPQEMLNRLEDADKKIEKLARTSEDAQVRIVSAFQSINNHGINAFIQQLDVAQQKLAQLGGTQLNMGVNANTSGFQQLIDAINNLSQASKTNITINGLGTVGNQTQTAIDAINKLMATLQQLQQMGGQQFLGGVNNLGRQTLREMNKEARKMQKTMQDLDAAIQNYGMSATDLANKLQQARQAQQQFNDAAKQQAQADFLGLLDMKGQQTTLNELKNYANELKRTMANLDPKSVEWKRLNNIYKQTNREIKNIQNSMKDVQKQSRSLMDVSGQLARRLALVFSVSQITGYVKKLIEVRGEFELQQRSLQAILQNKDEANRIWQQTVDLAVRSPFRVKELVSYTKQLAAYRIESDKLFETNKMLADISAGLGVDMQRLILAFGQVRSAAYLRGTELRQFTEAGIPILEQLAQYFTELEGRAVSVGDVFERVSKRMVSFADVEEIFRRMTSEGGSFYRMQEIQAETLKGMWSNLKDSVDIMVNEIGKGNESTLKNSLALVKQLVDNWRKVKPIIETVGISLMTYFGVDVLRKIGRALGSMLTTLSAHPVLAVASAFALLATYIWRAAKAQTEFNAAMSEVENENLKSLEEGIGLYHQLTEAINDVTKSNEERDKALQNLKSRFQDILPDQYLELEYIKQIGDNYKDAEKAMTDYYDAKTQAQKKDRIEGLYTKELDTDTSELISATRDVVSKLGEKGIISEDMQTAMLSGISGIVNKVVEDVKAGKIDANIEEIQGAIFSKLEDYAGYEGSLYGKISESPSLGLINFGEQVSDVTDTLREYLSALEDIQGLPYETYGQKVAGEWLNKEKESLRQISEIYKKLLSLYSKYSKATDEDKVDIADDISLAMSQVPENLNAYLPLLQESVDKMKGIAEKGAFEFTASMQTLESDFIEGLAGIAQYAEGEIGDVNGNKIAQTLSGNLQEGIKTASDKLDMTPFQNAVVGGARQIAAKFGQDVNIFEKFIPNQKESLSNIRQEVKSQIESYKFQILEMQTSLTQGMYVLSEEVLNNTQESIKSMTEQLPALKAFLAFLGEMEKDKGRKDKTIEERIKVVDQMNAKYKELNKTLSKTESLEGAFEAYKDAFATAYGREDVRQMSAEDFAKNVLNFPDEDAVITWLDNLAKTVKDKEDKFKVQMAKGKFEMDVQVRLKKEDDQELLDDIQGLFDQYDLSLELKKLNIPPDLAKSLFDVDYLDLDGLKKAVQEQEAKFIGTDMEKEYKDFLDKIADMEDKAAKERMKTYVEYARSAIGERAKIKLEELKKLKEIEETFAEKEGDSEETKKYKREQKQLASEKAQKESSDAMQKLEWEDFQKSDMFINIFEDLDGASDALLNHMIRKLQEFKNEWTDMPLEDMKKIVDKINELQMALVENNPWEAYKKSKEAVKDAMKGATFESEDAKTTFGDGKSQSAFMQALQLENVYQEQKKLNAQEELGYLETALRIKEGQATEEEKILEKQEDYNKYLRMSPSELKKQISAQKTIVKNAEDILSANEETLTESQKQAKALLKQADNLGKAQQMANDLYDAFSGLAEALGADSDSPAAIFADMGMNMLNTVLNTIQLQIQLNAATVAANGLGTAMNTAMGVVGWIVMAIQLVVQAITAIVNYADKQKEKEIERLAKRVEDLKEKFEDLSEAIDEAWSTSQLTTYKNELDQTYKMAVAAQKAIVAARADEKEVRNGKTDSEEYKQWEEAKKELEELEQEYAESTQNIYSKVTDGILDSVHDAAREFTDAWWDAFIETGDGLSGLEENFNEMFLNLAKNQAAMQITGAFADRWKKDLEKYINADDTELTKDEAKKWAEEVRRTMPELSEALEGYLGAFKDMATAEGAGLSGLQKGIQGITEDQADILAAYWNSVRGYTASIDSKMDLILANMGVGVENNPMLDQLVSQTNILTKIHGILEDVASNSQRTFKTSLL